MSDLASGCWRFERKMMSTTAKQETPDSFLIDANNWFHAGWLAGVLGLPQRVFNDVNRPVRDVDCDAWHEGYNVAIDTRYVFTDIVTRMRELGQLTVKSGQWLKDSSND
jgi:hypothetical protein